jgi:hypothetical protein
MDGTWLGDAVGSTLRTEKGDFTLFGPWTDASLLPLQDLRADPTVRHGLPTRSMVTLIWTFRKVSKREALWDGIPF